MAQAAPPSTRIRGAVAVLLVVLFLATNSEVVRAATHGGECPINCARYPTASHVQLTFGAPVSPIGYAQVSALCPGRTQSEACQPIHAPVFVSKLPNAPTFRCCSSSRYQFQVITGSDINQESPKPRMMYVYRQRQTVFMGRSGYTLRTALNSSHIRNCEDVHFPYINNVLVVEPPRGFQLDTFDFCYIRNTREPPQAPVQPVPHHPPQAPPPPLGTVYSDPKVQGGDGVTFYFHGRKDHDFCLVSDSDLHINAHFIGKRPAGRTRDFTWVQALGFVYGAARQNLTVALKRVGRWEGGVDYLEFAYNGAPLAVRPGAAWASPTGAVTLSRAGSAVVEVEIREKMGVSLRAVPIGKKESDKNGYGITDEDCFAHFDMQFRFYNLSVVVDGVLGQTYRPGFKNPAYTGVGMPVLGEVDRYESSSLLRTDCAASQFTSAAPGTSKSAMTNSFSAACGSSDLPHGVPGGITCRR